MQMCWRRWLLRYVLGLTPVKSDEFFSFGTTYHALHEGVPEADIAAWGEEFREALPIAKKLYEHRMDFSKSPPFPKGVKKEQTYLIDIPGTIGMTTKPDQEEMERGKLIPRDFKTAAVFHHYDSEDYAVSGQIIAEMLANGADQAVVDIIHKGKGDPESPSFGKVQQLQIVMTDAKREALFNLIDDLHMQLKSRLREAARLAKSKTAVKGPEELFPKAMNCVSKYGLCPYYDRCWHKGTAASFMFREAPHRWEPEGDPDRDSKYSMAAHAAVLKERLKTEL